MELTAFGQTITINNITKFDNDHIVSADFSSSILSVEKGKEPSTVYFNISCLAPSMQIKVDAEYCVETLGNEFIARDERDNNTYKIQYLNWWGGPYNSKIGSIDNFTYGDIYEDISRFIKNGLLFGRYTGLEKIGDFVISTDGDCVMTQDLRFEGINGEENDIEEKIVNIDGKDVNIGSNIYNSNYKGELTETIPGKAEADGYTWKSNGLPRYVSSKNEAVGVGTWYNFYAAFPGFNNNEIPTPPKDSTSVKEWSDYGSPIADICPANWHILFDSYFEGLSGGEQKMLLTAYSNQGVPFKTAIGENYFGQAKYGGWWGIERYHGVFFNYGKKIVFYSGGGKAGFVGELAEGDYAITVAPFVVVNKNRWVWDNTYPMYLNTPEFTNDKNFTDYPVYAHVRCIRSKS